MHVSWRTIAITLIEVLTARRSMSVNRLVNGSCVRNGTIDTMPPAGKLEFPDGRPKLYRAMLVIVACTLAAWLLISYLIPKYWSVPIADKAHPDTIRLDRNRSYFYDFALALYGFVHRRIHHNPFLGGIGILLPFGWCRGSSDAGRDDPAGHQSRAIAGATSPFHSLTLRSGF